MIVRTRFAPSPTGSLHIGGVRTALFSYLFAKHHQGQFLLRMEDTDLARSTAASVETILQGLAWLGLQSDEPLVYQTTRFARYHEMAEQLIRTGHAYRCYCSKERLETLREQQLAAKEKPRYDGLCRECTPIEGQAPFVIRFKTPSVGHIRFADLVYGEIQVENQELDDLILIRSDGIPTYNFAVVIDDADMQITHVIRGDDHINNTPRQIHLYQALGFSVPAFAHLPMILGEDGKRLSKRHGAVSVMEFQKLGILPHALLNDLVRLGWSHGDQEVFSMDEMIRYFDLAHVSRGVSKFSYEKLYWLNQHYQKEDAPECVAKALAWHFENAGIEYHEGPSLEALVAVQADRCKTLAEMFEKSRMFYEDDVLFDEAARNKNLVLTAVAPLTVLFEKFEALTDWQAASLHACIHEVCDALSLGMGKVALPLRIAVTGTTQSPAIDLTLALLGKKRVLARVAAAIAWIQNTRD